MIRKTLFVDYATAKKLARSLSFKSGTEWKKWAKTNARPANIPSYPNEAYANKGWTSWGDFLGTGYIASQNREYMPYIQARDFIRSLALKNNKDWRKWSKSDARPLNMPTSPDKAYAKSGWASWGDFLGTRAIGASKKKFKSFGEAKTYAQSLGFKCRKEWEIWVKTDARPDNIPSNPNYTYKDNGWIGWGDWFGTGTLAHFKKVFRPFEEARSFARALELKSKDDWSQWTQTAVRPSDIPTAPDRTYATQGWIDWEDWLGSDNMRWTIDKLRNFVRSFLPHIKNMSQMDRLVILQTRGIFSSIKGKIIAQKILKDDELTIKDLEKFSDNQESDIDGLLTNNVLNDNEDEIAKISSVFDTSKSFNIAEDLPVVETKNVLASVAQSVVSGFDNETVEFLVASAVSRIWKHAFEDPKKALLQVKIELSSEEIYMRMVKNQFLSEYQEAEELVIPEGYSFPGQPELMQKYTASLIKRRKRIGNWCGTGAGKTLASILASRVINAQLTIICCPNNVIDTWKKEIHKAYPDSVILVNNIKGAIKISSKPHYLILNYDIFRHNNIANLLNQIVLGQKIDFIIIDEVHYSKQRHKEKLSQRRETLLQFLAAASAHNEQLHVLGMSATPVINNLYEGKTLIELITGKKYDDLETRPTIDNCVALYKQLILHGFRWLPNYKIVLNVTPESYINCTSLLPDIVKLLRIGNEPKLTKKSALNPCILEALLTKAKTPFILDNLRPHTIVYTYYIRDIVIPLQKAIETAGWSVGLFTGQNKDGLAPFLRKKIDVLIVSSCAGTGLDGLQKVSNRIIINSLPWTHAEFKQLQGRILRKGQLSTYVDIFVPLTFVEVENKKWSWCESRWERIQFKKSIADAAVDGFLPEGTLISEQQAMQDAKTWLERIVSGKINEIIRQPIEVTSNNELATFTLRKIPDLTMMNQKINHATSAQTHQRFLSDPSEWHDYHATYRENRKNWEVIPYKEAIKWCKARPYHIIGDFGCGEALLAKDLSNKVHSFDHVAINNNVVACDISNIPLQDESLNVAIFSLSLMGTNFVDYLREAHRCLRLDGHIWISEPTSRFTDMDLFKELLERLGFDIRRISEKGKFTFIEAIKSDRNINEEMIKALIEKQLLL